MKNLCFLLITCTILFLLSCKNSTNNRRNFDLTIIVTDKIGSSKYDKIPNDIIKLCETISSEDSADLYIPQPTIKLASDKNITLSLITDINKELPFAAAKNAKNIQDCITKHLNNLAVGGDFCVSNTYELEKFIKILKKNKNPIFCYSQNIADTIYLGYKVYNDLAVIRNEFVQILSKNSTTPIVVVYEPTIMGLISDEKLDSLKTALRTISSKVNDLVECIENANKKLNDFPTYNKVSNLQQELTTLLEKIEQQNNENNPDITNSITKADGIIKTFQEKLFLQMDKECKRISTVREYKQNADKKPASVINIEPNRRIEELEKKLQYYETQNKSLIKRNDTLESEISLVKTQIKRAKDLENNRKLEADKTIQESISEQLNEILLKVENKINALVPDMPQQSVVTKTDTVKITITNTVPDYKGTADKSFEKAKSDFESLKKEPPKVGIIFKKQNTTKIAWEKSTLESFQKAIDNYNLAKEIEKAKEVEKVKKEFEELIKIK